MRGSWACSWRRKRGFDTYARYAVLVESTRINGKPRQRFVAHLATILEPLMDMALHRGLFWKEVNEKLNSLHIDDKTKAKITGKLLITIPLPDEARRAAEQAELKRLERLLRSA